MTATQWTVPLIQILTGLCDTVFHHEGTRRLAWRPAQAGDLGLHGVRNPAYALVCVALRAIVGRACVRHAAGGCVPMLSS